jgi:hypothetical protein
MRRLVIALVVIVSGCDPVPERVCYRATLVDVPSFVVYTSSWGEGLTSVEDNLGRSYLLEPRPMSECEAHQYTWKEPR